VSPQFNPSGSPAYSPTSPTYNYSPASPKWSPRED
jgi:hypothetical protein